MGRLWGQSHHAPGMAAGVVRAWARWVVLAVVVPLVLFSVWLWSIVYFAGGQ